MPETIRTAYFEAVIETNKRTIAVDGETLSDFVEALREATKGQGFDPYVVGLPELEDMTTVASGLLVNLGRLIAEGGGVPEIAAWIERQHTHLDSWSEQSG